MGKLTRQEATEKLEAAIVKLVADKDFKVYASLRQRLKKYSPNNRVLIWMQGGTMVAGYKQWKKEYNRHVVAGGKSIKILAPIIIKRKNEETGKEERILIGFTEVSVFDISQTDGEPLKKFSFEPEGDNAAEYLPKLDAWAQAQGITLEYGPSENGEGGWYNPKTDTVRVATDRPVDAQVQAMLHELAHRIGHKKYEHAKESYGDGEVIVHMAQYLVAQNLGIKNTEESAYYLGSWGDGDPKAIMRRLKDAEAIAVELEAACGI